MPWQSFPRAHVAFAAFAIVAATAPARAADPPASPTPEQLAEAKTHMQAGAAFYNDPSGHKCEEAYREFKQAYELSGSQNALKGMGVCALELERDGDAIDHFQRYLEKPTNGTPQDRAQVETDLRTLKAAVATVTVTIDRPTAKLVDVRTPSRGFPVTNRYTLAQGETKLGLHPGDHALTVSAEGQPDQVWKVEVANGGTYAHTFVLTAPKQAAAAAVDPAAPKRVEASATRPREEKGRPVPTSVYVMGGVTLAAAIPMGIFMGVAKSKNGDYAAVNGTLPAADLEAKRSDVKTMNLVADVFLGVTAASLVTTGILFFTRPTVGKPRPAADVAIAPAVGPSGGGIAAVGTF